LKQMAQYLSTSSDLQVGEQSFWPLLHGPSCKVIFISFILFDVKSLIASSLFLIS
jgi:hypothetical protein